MKNFISWILTSFFIILIGSIYIPKIYQNHIKLNNILKQNHEMKEEIAIIKKDIIQEDIKILSLKDDFVREKIARRQLSLVKTNEKVYKYIKKTQEEK